MPSPIGVADLSAGARHAANNSFGSLYFSPRTMMVQAIRAILLASATAATFVGRRSINRPSHGRLSVPCLRVRHEKPSRLPPPSADSVGQLVQVRDFN